MIAEREVESCRNADTVRGPHGTTERVRPGFLRGRRTVGRSCFQRDRPGSHECLRASQDWANLRRHRRWSGTAVPGQTVYRPAPQ